MLGQLLQFSIRAQARPATLAAYRALGFQPLRVSDVPGAPYAALWDGDITLGLVEEELDAAVPTFVRPDLKMYSRGLRHVGVELAYARLADDEFNQAGFRDPNGHLVALVEARTFSPAPRERTSIRPCGVFLEWSVATDSLEASERFWTALGLRRSAAGDDPLPWVRLEGHGLSVGFHAMARLAPGLTYRAPDLGARLAYLQAKGIPVQRGAPLAPRDATAATLHLPDDMKIYLVEGEGE